MGCRPFLLHIHQVNFIMGTFRADRIIGRLFRRKTIKMKLSHRQFYWISVIALVVAALACTIPGLGAEISQEVVLPEEPVQLATLPGNVAPTLTPFPTFTPYPTFTIAAVLEPTATGQPEEQELPESRTNPGDGAEMVYVPAGEFLMGTDAPASNMDERPQHTVYLDAFWIYRTTVTNSQYRQCIDAKVCEGSLNRYPENNLPAVNVSWFDSKAYCEWVGGQLPTEAQWEKTARGTDGRAFPWGDQMPTCELANFKNCYGSKEIGVNRLAAGASPYGALHMVGNVWEWVSDWYDPDYYQVSPDANPSGPDIVEERFRVQRGGSFENEPNTLYITLRSRSKPDKADYRKGFRCVIGE